MERWVIYAFLAMLFAGFTSVIAKQGLVNISGELGLTVRTIFVCLFVFAFASLAVPVQQLRTVAGINIFWLAFSALTTTFSWIFYYKALKEGDVATISLIDKGSVVITIFMAWLFLKEDITPRIMLGAALIVSGLLVMLKK